MRQEPSRSSRRFSARMRMVAGLILVVMIAAALFEHVPRLRELIPPASGVSSSTSLRRPLDTGGFFDVMGHLPRWKPEASLEEVAERVAASRLP